MVDDMLPPAGARNMMRHQLPGHRIVTVSQWQTDQYRHLLRGNKNLARERRPRLQARVGKAATAALGADLAALV